MYQQIQDLLDKIGPYPEKPTKPILPVKHNLDQIHMYAAAMAEYEAKFVEFETDRAIYYQRKGEIEHMVTELISRESGLFSVPEQYRDKIWRISWEEGHSAGYYEVYQWLCKLVEIFE